MIQSNAMVFGWDRAVAGREGMASELFTQCVTWLDKWKAIGAIEAWEPWFLGSHGGDLNGMFLIKGTASQLTALRGKDEWLDITLRATQCLTRTGVVDAFWGAPCTELMARWTKAIPPR